MKKLKNILLAAVIGCTLVSCHKDSEYEDSQVITSFSPEVLKEKDGHIVGYIYDEHNQPVAGAAVSIYSATTTTDQYGVFRFDDVKLDPNGTYIKAEKPGYTFGSDKIYPVKATAYSSIQVFQQSTSNSFNAAAGGTIEAEGGGKIAFQPQSIASANGEKYSGTVYVTAHVLAADDANLGDKMPGDLVADDENGNTVALGSAGMLLVELRDNSGNELNLAAGKTARISIPKPTFGPDEIGLWSFNEASGRWQNEGKAVTEGGFYVADVSHFSFWNCDAPFPLIHLCGKVVTEDGEGLRTRIRITVDGLGAGYGYTDENGEFCGKVPKGKELQIEVLSPYCSESILTKTVGPFDNNVQLNALIVTKPVSEITARVTCSGTNYADATVLLRTSDRSFVVNNYTDNPFIINLNTFCPNIDDLEILAYDNATNQASSSLIVSTAPGFVHELEVCTSPCDFTGDLIYECGDPAISVALTNASGAYTYEWNTGDTSAITELLPDVTSYCVTITEVGGGCEKTYCTQASLENISIDFFANPCQGEVVIRVRGGIPPYNVSTSLGNSFTMTANTYTVFLPASQDFCIDVTDDNNCTANKCEFLNVDPLGLFVDTKPASCSGGKYEFASSDFDVGWIYSSNGIQLTLQYPIIVDVFQVGYGNFELVILKNQCEIGELITIPSFQGLDSIQVKHTSCMGCTDGQITATIDGSADCNSCTLGPIVVLNEDHIDVTSENEAGELTAGEYYYVVTDLNTGCYIAHQKVNIE